MVEKRRREGVVVPGMSTAAIANAALEVRKVFGATTEPLFPVVAVYELLDVLVDGGHFEVVEDDAMGEDEARTFPDRGLIQLRQSVYDGAAQGQGRPRFTMCHELAHLVVHRNISFSRVNPVAPPKIYQNSEWQADVFASHLLMPEHLLRDYWSVEAVAEDFGVSYAAANARLEKMKKGVMKVAS